MVNMTGIQHEYACNEASIHNGAITLNYLTPRTTARNYVLD